ncbi:Galactose-1-phosphate uridylyltransferase [Paenibacillus sp. CECT 9249]|nr:Galactose-1-phosphate uridylyltransferase [Paenibacillus sp. CECT 9249]
MYNIRTDMGTDLMTNGRQRAGLAIEQLLRFALRKRLIQSADLAYCRNQLLDLFQMPEPYDGPVGEETYDEPHAMLATLIEYGFALGLMPEQNGTYADLLDAKIMGLLTPRPSEVEETFRRNREESGVEAATGAFYRLSIDSNYIRMDRIRKNVYWLHPSEFGEIEMTINLSKPEKSPQEIALAKQQTASSYPKCLLCAENVGYAGRLNHPARQNLRIIPVRLNGESWYFQYSPYVYYNEHCIVFHHDHVPMKLTSDTFARLVDFVEQFPHYFIGTNADLPIVGGSILTHDHFQGGHHTFPIEKAPTEEGFSHRTHSGLRLRIVKWPMSVLRLSGKNRDALLRAANEIYESWKAYSDEEAQIYAFSGSGAERVPHNTVTPIVRLNGQGEFEMDLVLRNNRTDERHPEGIFHPHRHLHHIKKENIGLIEVMGVAILPGRLKRELEQIGAILRGKTAWNAEAANGPLAGHAAWIQDLIERYGIADRSEEETMRSLQHEVGSKFVEILSNAGVYKRTEAGKQAFRRFVQSMGWE